MFYDEEISEEEYDEYDDEGEEKTLPNEDASFRRLRRVLKKAFEEYSSTHKSMVTTEFITAVENYLDKFGNGIEPEREFIFGFVLEKRNERYHEIQIIDFNFESEMIEIFAGGSECSVESIGYDSYTDWDYSIGLDGYAMDENYGNILEILDFVRNGAMLTIESPEEFVEV